MGTMSCRILLLLFSICGSANWMAAADNRDFAIVDTNVVDVVGGTLRAHQTVIVHGEHIAEAAAANQVSVPNGVQRIPGEGLYIMPGLWDMHVHLRNGQPRTGGLRNVVGGLRPLVEENAALLDLFLPNGVVGIREMGGDLATYVREWRDEIQAGKRVGPRIITAMRKVDKEPPSWPGSLAATTPEEAREAVRQMKRSGADFIKVYFSTTSREVLSAVCDEAHKLKLRVVGHWPENIPLQSVADIGQDGVEHAIGLFVYRADDFARMENEFAVRRKIPALAPDFFEERSRLLFMLDRDAEIRTYEAMAAKHIWVTPTVTALRRGYIDIGVQDYTKDPRRRYAAPAVWNSWDAKQGGRQSAPEGPARDLASLILKEAEEALMRAYRAKVPMLVGTDSGVFNSYMFPGFSIHEEMADLVDLGFSVPDVLRMATINAAEWRGDANSEGSIEKGKVADLVVLRSNPLTAIRHTQEIEGLAHAGKFYSRLELDRMLEQAAEKAAGANGAVPTQSAK